MQLQSIDLATRQIGVNFIAETGADVLVWCPAATSLELLLLPSHLQIPLEKDHFGYWSVKSNLLQPGDKYRFLIDGKKVRPDPASLSQPEGVHGPSQAIDLSFNWSDQSWIPAPKSDWIIYELHTGTFSESGDFSGIESRLDHLLELGINAIEIMPVAQFPGSRNWGYDGVFPFAVHNSYGGAAGLQRLVNTCHQKGLSVILDVVYNHIGPEGNYLPDFGPYFTDKYKTPWGSAINFDDAECDPVRLYFTENVLMWFRDFHIDALRLDAVHAIKDFSALHILEEIKKYTDKLSRQTGRSHSLIIEMDLNDPRYINPLSTGGYGMDAQWIDEFHHALRVTAGGSRSGYYSDFNGIEDLAKSYRDAYVYDGQYSSHRKRKFGARAEKNPGNQFIVFSQNHDQVGNRMLGERSSQLFSSEMQKLMAAAVMVGPFIPMLFMGEEWSETAPFLYFVSHSDEALSAAVKKGRREEFAAFHTEGEAPDPTLPETFERSKLQWSLLDESEHRLMFDYYRELIRLRKKYPALKELSREGLNAVADNQANTLMLTRRSDAQTIICLLNFSQVVAEFSLPQNKEGWKRIFDSSGFNQSGEYHNAGSIEVNPTSISIFRN